jgi:hypothetical protein
MAWIKAYWIKDALAGAGLIVFMISSFALASLAPVLINAI